MVSEIAAPPRPVRRVVHSALKSPPSIDLYEVTAGQRHKLRVVSSELYSVWVHQSGRRALPCYGEHDCECEHHRLPVKQQHYLFVELPDNTKLRLVRLTSGLVYRHLPQLTEVGRNLNGVTIELWREHDGKYDSPLLGHIVVEECVTKLVRETPDIKWAVERIITAPDRQAPWTRRRPTVATQTGFRSAEPERKRSPEEGAAIKLALTLAKDGKHDEAAAVLAEFRAQVSGKGGDK